ncbi:MAG: hypothetical protein KatS3mg102_1734 [Planctomycetota bacterium]|nr:MAG: hypothetical protein KatS3mg102_1734 [Planctomycetota bacterium]
MARISKTERLLNLVSYLLKERQPVPWRDIAGRVVGYDDGSDPKSLERRFERDKAALKEMGIPIRYCPPGAFETEGYMIPREAVFLDEVDLLPHEVALLNLISEHAIRNRSEFLPDLISALRKLSFDVDLEAAGGGRPAVPAPPRRRRGRPRRAAPLPQEQGSEGSAWRSAVLHLDLIAGLRADPNLPALVAAALASRTVAFDYYSMSRDETRRRTVDPYGLGYARGAWYLVGRDHWRDRVQSFRLDRIRGGVATISEPHAFSVPEEFRLHDYLERPPWEYSDAPPTEVVIEADAHIGWFLQGPISRRSLEPLPGGGVRMVFEVRRREAFIAWVLPKLRHVRIVEPESMRRELLAALDQLLERHRPEAAAGGAAGKERPQQAAPHAGGGERRAGRT